MIYATKSKFGAISPTPYVAAGAVQAGQLVKLDAAGAIVECEENDTAVLGVSTDSAAAAGDPVRVIEAYPGVRFRMPLAAALSPASIGKTHAIAVADGEQQVDNGDDVADPVKLLHVMAQETDVDGRSYALVEVLATKSQALVDRVTLP